MTRKKVARLPGDRAQRIIEGRVAKVDGDRRFPKRWIERQADIGKFRNREEHVAAARLAEDERGRHLGVRRQVETGRREIARRFDQRLQRRLAFTRHRGIRAQLVACRAQRGVDVSAAWIQLGRHLVFDERLVVLAERGLAASALKVVARGAELGAIETEARIGIVGMETNGVVVFDDRDVVILPIVRLDPLAKGGRGGAPGRRQQESQSEYRQAPASDGTRTTRVTAIGEAMGR